MSETKYVFLYNIDLHLDQQMKNKVLKVVPEALILNEERFCGEVHKGGHSIWVPEDKYLIAWTICNSEELLDTAFWDDEPETTSDDGVEWFNSHRNDDFYCKWL